MDPDRALDEQVAVATRILAGIQTKNDEERLAELVVALNHHIRNGGALPELWVLAQARRGQKRGR